jgi:hypothetical protein
MHAAGFCHAQLLRLLTPAMLQAAALACICLQCIAVLQSVFCAAAADVADANGQPAGAAPLGSPSSAPSDASELVDPLSEAAGVQLSRRNSFEVRLQRC